MKKSKKEIQKEEIQIELLFYEKACNDITKRINRVYFDRKQTPCWIGDEIGCVCNMGDWFFDMDYMVTALKYEATEDQFFDYYNKQMEKTMKDEKMEYSFMDYIQYYKGLIK